MKSSIFLTFLILCLSLQLKSQNRLKIIAEVERFLLKDNARVSSDKASSNLCQVLSKKLGTSIPHPSVVDAVSTLISNYRSQEVSAEAGNYKVALFGDLIGDLVFSVQSIRKIDSKTCAKEKREMMEELDDFIRWLRIYMRCIAEHSGWKYPKLRSARGPLGGPRPPGYEESNDATDGPGRINPIPAPSPPEGTGTPRTPQHPCTREKNNLEDGRARFNRAAQAVEEACG